MKKIAVAGIIWIIFFECLYAQSSIDKTMETFSTAVGRTALGIGEYDFFGLKPGLELPKSEPGAFRDEVVEPIGKNGISSITYYFDTEESKPLYEFIIAFDNESIRDAFAEKLLGKPNYPDKPGYWVAGGEGGTFTVAWAFDDKFVIAENIAGTEWFGNKLFALPAGFDLHKKLPGMSTWPEEKLAEFYISLEKQIAAAVTDFNSIREQTEIDNHYPCNSPLTGAENAYVFEYEPGKWAVGNIMVSGVNAENAILWRLDAKELFSTTKRINLKLSHHKLKAQSGKNMDLWDILDTAGKSTNLQLGIVNYQTDENLWNVEIMVIKQ